MIAELDGTDICATTDRQHANVREPAPRKNPVLGPGFKSSNPTPYTGAGAETSAATVSSAAEEEGGQAEGRGAAHLQRRHDRRERERQRLA